MQITYENEKIDLPDGSGVKEVVEKFNLRDPDQAMALSINGTLCDLTTPFENGDEVKLWSFEDKIGKEVYWHTSAHVLAQAVLRLYPEAKPTIGPPIENGFYYDFANLHISEEDFPKIEQKMAELRDMFGIKQEELALDLGPVDRLLGE